LMASPLQLTCSIAIVSQFIGCKVAENVYLIN
jgi:hypothetical protein